MPAIQTLEITQKRASGAQVTLQSIPIVMEWIAPLFIFHIISILGLLLL